MRHATANRPSGARRPLAAAIAVAFAGSLGALFDGRLPAEVIKEKLFKRFAVLVTVLEQQEYLLPSGFSVADALLFVVLRWAGLFDIDLAQWPALARPEVRVRTTDCARPGRVSSAPRAAAAAATEGRPGVTS